LWRAGPYRAVVGSRRHALCADRRRAVAAGLTRWLHSFVGWMPFSTMALLGGQEKRCPPYLFDSPYSDGLTLAGCSRMHGAWALSAKLSPRFFRRLPCP